MKIWTITTSDDSGTATQAHTTEASARAQYARIVAASWESWFGESAAPMPDDTAKAWEVLSDQTGFLDSLTIEEHDIADPIQASPEAQAYREAAKRQHHREGECEIDDNATVSFGEDAGAYVQAWVWIPAADAGLDVEE